MSMPSATGNYRPGFVQESRARAFRSDRKEVDSPKHTEKASLRSFSLDTEEAH